jgi:hypothetical protein
VYIRLELSTNPIFGHRVSLSSLSLSVLNPPPARVLMNKRRGTTYVRTYHTDRHELYHAHRSSMTATYTYVVSAGSVSVAVELLGIIVPPVRAAVCVHFLIDADAPRVLVCMCVSAGVSRTRVSLQYLLTT